MEWEKITQELWALFKETNAQFKETAARFRETDARFKETDARLKALFEETDARFKKVAEQMEETDRKIKELSNMFTHQWGRMVEALVAPKTLELFRERKIEVHQVFQRAKVKLNGKTKMEIDLLLTNKEEVVAIEVKSALKVRDVQEFLEKMREFKRYFPQYEGYRIYGGVAGLEIVGGVDKYAYRNGLFVISATGEGMATIKNDLKFRPYDFGRETTEGEEISG